MTRRRVRSSRAGRVAKAFGPQRSSPPGTPRGAAGTHPLPAAPRGSVTASVQGALAATLRCPACRVRACGPKGLCAACEALLTAAVHALPAPSGDTLWLGPHAGIWRRLVHALKYRHSRRLAGFLAQLLHARLVHWGWQPNVIVHVPTTTARRKQRSYDQAELLAAALALRTGTAHVGLLKRRSSTAKLVGQGRAARAASLAHAFAARPVTGRQVLLVDDVLTSGATLAAARAALTAAGAAEVRAAVVARTAPSHEEGAELAKALALLEPPPAGLDAW